MLARDLASAHEGLGVCLSCIDKPCALQLGSIGWMFGFHVRRLMVMLGQQVDSMPRTGRDVAAPWFSTKIPLKVAGGRIEHDLLMRKTLLLFWLVCHKFPLVSWV